MKNNNNNIPITSNSSHNNNQQNTHHDRRKPQQNQYNQHQQRQYQGQRESSGQRNQHPDSSMGRESTMNYRNQIDLGAIKFTPSQSTIELPPIETKNPNKKFTGRCRLFIGNIPLNTPDDKVRALFESYGEVGEVFLGPKSAFAFIYMDTRQNAEAARDALDCTTYKGRTLRVRLAAHPAAIRVKYLSQQVTNELLAYTFRTFGEIERAVVVVDDKGKSTGEGVVEFAKKHAAFNAIRRCQQDCLILTASPRPVHVEAYDQQDEEEGLSEKSINKGAPDFEEQRKVGPRFAEHGTFEHTFALKWKELYETEKQKREQVEREIQEARKHLENQIDDSRREHNIMQLRNQLQRLEGEKMNLQQQKEAHIMTEAQMREEYRRQQDMMLRQRDDNLRRQQLSDPDNSSHIDTSLRMQGSTLQQSNDDAVESNQAQPHSTGSQAGLEGDSGVPISIAPPQPARTFADAAMMSLNQPYIPVQQQMSMQPPPHNNQMNQPNMFTTYMPIPTIDSSAGYNSTPLTSYYMEQSGAGRQQRFSRQYNNTGNSSNGGRQRKRGRYQ